MLGLLRTLSSRSSLSRRLSDNAVAQITSALYRNAADDATIIGFQHAYDKVGNPDYEVRVHQSSYGDEYTYDNLYRVTRTVYDDSTPTSPMASPAATAKDDFMHDDIPVVVQRVLGNGFGRFPVAAWVANAVG